MRLAMIGFVVGAACLQIQAALPPLAWTAAGVGMPFAWWAVHRWLRPAWRALLALPAGAVVGFCWAAWLAHAALAPHLAAADEGRDIKLVGTIDNLPYRFSQGVRFNFAVERADAEVPPKIALAWYLGYRDQVAEVPDVQPGERWQLTVRLQRPHGNEMWNAINLIALLTVMRSTSPSFQRTSESKSVYILPIASRIVDLDYI